MISEFELLSSVFTSFLFSLDLEPFNLASTFFLNISFKSSAFLLVTTSVVRSLSVMPLISHNRDHQNVRTNIFTKVYFKTSFFKLSFKLPIYILILAKGQVFVIKTIYVIFTDFQTIPMESAYIFRPCALKSMRNGSFKRLYGFPQKISLFNIRQIFGKNINSVFFRHSFSKKMQEGNFYFFLIKCYKTDVSEKFPEISDQVCTATNQQTKWRQMTAKLNCYV